MLNQISQPDPGLRYDSETQRRVVELAVRLQQEDQERQTVHQIMDAAGEIGLDPHYVQRALEQVQTEQAIPQVMAAKPKRPRTVNRGEYRRFVAAMVAPMALGAFAFALKDFVGIAILLTTIFAVPLSCLSGFLTGRKRVGFVTAALLILSLAPTAYHIGIHEFYATHNAELFQSWFQQSARSEATAFAIVYLMLGLPLAGLLGIFGAWTRQRYLPHPANEEI